MSSYPPPPVYPAGGGLPGGVPSSEDRTWAGAAHWGAIVCAFVALAFLAPLAVLVLRGGQSPFVRRHAVNGLNFHLSMLIYSVVGGVVAVLVAIVTFGLGILLIIPLAIAVGVFWLVVTIIAAVKASNGQEYRYPLAIPMVH
ncbi:DUF4870 domain-containing protein [Nocardioides marinquilinus]|uniref:DUF4870 domain-containing protein n=1 Tax=Nocardioides marinquilinus TaxID=1210400 RepID=A0ABP9Q881_9ACTN